MYVSIALGVAYGLALRVLLAINVEWFAGIVSISFFVLVPIVIGFMVIYFDDPERSRRFSYAIFVPWIAIGCFLLTTMVLLLEGSICVILALPGFLALSSAGGLVAAWMIRMRPPTASFLCVVIVMPALVSPIEATLPPGASFETVINRIEIEAPPEAVWAQITHVEAIQEDELVLGLTRLLGVPRPLEAHMEQTATGWVRHTRWEQGITFREIITSSRENERVMWEFDFPPGAVPDGVLDDHIRIGGRHFELTEGGYTLARLPNGGTALELSTSYRVTARPAVYSRYWARLVMGDFHKMILDLIRDRSERDAG